MHLYRRLFDRACGALKGGTLDVEYWDGASVTYGHGEPRVGLKLRRPGIVPGLLLNPELCFGEAYMRGDLEIAGEIEAFLVVTATNDLPASAFFDHLGRFALALSRLQPLSIGRHRRDVRRHYDLGNDFYRLWLDPTMSYSCAMFQSPDEDLETAQRRKIRRTLEKLSPQPGETLLDIGCGWGGIVREAAEQFGMNATGITLSEEQAAWFEARPPSSDSAAAVEIAHYHALADRGERFDKIVSVGMAEHVGRAHLPGYFADIKRLLHPGGLGLVHCITYLEEEPTNPWITKYIFPGGYIPSLAEVVRGLSRRGFVVWDVENIGPSYATTLDRWSDGFEAHIDEVAATYGEEFVRMWRLYLAYCAFSFRHEETFVHQVLFSNGKPGSPVVRGS